MARRLAAPRSRMAVGTSLWLVPDDVRGSLAATIEDLRPGSGTSPSRPT